MSPSDIFGGLEAAAQSYMIEEDGYGSREYRYEWHRGSGHDSKFIPAYDTEVSLMCFFKEATLAAACCSMLAPNTSTKLSKLYPTKKA
jgi:hypothetical protein